MTREEFFKKYDSLKTECDELRKKLNSAIKESEILVAENVKNLLGVEVNDIIYQKSSGDAYKIYNIFLQGSEICLSIELCGMCDYDMSINDEIFLNDYMTESQWKEFDKKLKEEKEYNGYITGAEEQQEIIIQRASKWLKENQYDFRYYETTYDGGYKNTYINDDFIQGLIQALKGE